MINMLKKVAKSILISIGSLVIVAVMGIGSVGIYYKETSINFYDGLRKGIIETAQQVKDGLGSAKNSVAEIFEKGQESLENLNSDLTKLKDEVKNIDDSSTKNQINNLIDNIQTAIVQLENQIGTQKSDGESNNNQNEIESAINKFIDTTTDITNQIQEVAGSLSTSQFSETYEVVTISMTAIPAVILVTVIVTTIIQLIMYKKVFGVKVRRIKAKSDLVKYVNKILKKYPDIKNSIK